MIRRIQQNARAAARHKIELPDTYTALKAHVDPGVDLAPLGPKGMMPRTFIHFSDIEKLGIYPKSKYNTPVGIYAYPLTDIILRKFQIGALPFAQDRSLVILFDVKDTRGLAYSSQDIPKRKYEWLKRQILGDARFQDNTWQAPQPNFVLRIAGIKKNYLRSYFLIGPEHHYRDSLREGRLHLPFKAFRRYLAEAVVHHAGLDFTDVEKYDGETMVRAQIEDDIFDLLDQRHLLIGVDPREFGGYMDRHLREDWWRRTEGEEVHDEAVEILETLLDEMEVTVELSFDQWEQEAYVDEINLGKLWNITRNLVDGNPRQWTQLLREFEIDGVVDDAGYGLIHLNESIQAVFFGAAILRVVDIFPNEYTPSKIRRRKARAVDE